MFTSSGAFLAKWGTQGSGDGQFYSPEGIAVDGTGNVYVADTGNNRVQVFGRSPTPIPTVTATPPHFVAGDILTIGTNETVVIAGMQSDGAAMVYTAYDAISGAGRWEIPKYWQGGFQVDEQTLVASLNAHRVSHADPVLVIITDPTVTGGDMKVTGLSLAEALPGVAYPVEPASGEAGSGVPLYVSGDILSNLYASAGGTLIGGFNNDSQLYSTYDVVKNGDRWDIDYFDFYGFGLPESYLISSGMRRIAHADPHTVLINDTASNTGDTTWYHLSFAEYLAGEGHQPESWQDPPSTGDPRYLVGDVLGTDASTTTGHVVAGIDMTNGAYPIYTTHDVVKNGTRWEIPKFTGGDSPVDAYGVFAQGWHRIDHRDPHFVIVTDRTGTPGGPAYGGLSLGEILGGTPGYLFEAASPAPFTSLSVPGRIQAEDYDLGGEGVAYHDTTPGNLGGACRHDDVDIETGNGITDVGWIRSGEYLTYTVNVSQNGTYALTARVASPNSGRTVALSVDGGRPLTLGVPNTGSFGTYTTAGSPQICVDFPPRTPVPGPTGVCYPEPALLSAGTHTLKLAFQGDGQNLDWFEFTPFVPPTPMPLPNGSMPFRALAIPGTIQAEDYDLGGEGVAYHDTTPGNLGGAYRHDDVDIETAGSTMNVGWIRNGEWLTYTANVSTAGAYTMTARVATPNSGRTIAVQVDGAPTATVAVPNTGSFATFRTVKVQVPHTVAAGTHTLKLTFGGDGQNLDWIAFGTGGMTSPTTTTTTLVPSGGASFTAAPLSASHGSAVKFTVTPASGKSIQSAWWSFDAPAHLNTWNSLVINPTFFYPAAGTFSPLVKITYTDATTETVQRTGYIRAT